MESNHCNKFCRLVHNRFANSTQLERIIRIELTSSAWKADALTVVLYPHCTVFSADGNRFGAGPGDQPGVYSCIFEPPAGIEPAFRDYKSLVIAFILRRHRRVSQS